MYNALLNADADKAVHEISLHIRGGCEFALMADSGQFLFIKNRAFHFPHLYFRIDCLELRLPNLLLHRGQRPYFLARPTITSPIVSMFFCQRSSGTSSVTPITKPAWSPAWSISS